MSFRVNAEIVCVNCGDSIKDAEPCKVFQFGIALFKIKERAIKLGWLFKNEGGKGIKHWCPKCAHETPLIAEWMVKRALAGKNPKVS